MDFIWLIIEVAIVVTAICTGVEIIRRRRYKLPKCEEALDHQRLHAINVTRPSPRPEHQVKRISMKECETLIQVFDNVIFIALRQRDERAHVQFPAMRVASVAPSELIDVLKLIPDYYVVLCGEVDLCSSILKTMEEIDRSTPIYILDAATAVRAGTV